MDLKEFLHQKAEQHIGLLQQTVNGQRQSFSGLAFSFQYAYLEALADVAEQLGDKGLAEKIDRACTRANSTRECRHLQPKEDISAMPADLFNWNVQQQKRPVQADEIQAA